mgnify:CR=1 FL=1
MVIVGQGLQVFVEYSLEYPDSRRRKPDLQRVAPICVGSPQKSPYC